VTIDGHEGRVIRLTSRATILLDMNGNHVRLPNSMVYKSTMVNYSRNSKRRFQFDVGVDTDVDPALAQGLAVKTLEDLDGVLAEPAPQCVVHALGDSNVVLRVFGWIDQTVADFTKTRSASMAAIKQAFEAAEINMPEPIYRLRVENVESTGSKSAIAAKVQVISPLAATDLKPDTAITDQVQEHRDGDDLLNVNAPRE
jgi:small-conductance mechanosensitive channel